MIIKTTWHIAITALHGKDLCLKEIQKKKSNTKEECSFKPICTFH